MLDGEDIAQISPTTKKTRVSEVLYNLTSIEYVTLLVGEFGNNLPSYEARIANTDPEDEDSAMDIVGLHLNAELPSDSDGDMDIEA
jgi:hypothetical protein